jgi:hypothetical protein
MAQIIKHRRGSLESVSSATKRAGELLVVTGSAGITATNGGSILFVGVDGSTVTPANKILQGTTVPNLTGGSYDTSIDGIPFYDTDDNKLYILNKGGNVEVKTTANTGGTGIVSGSTQVLSLLPFGTVSGSNQITYEHITAIPAGIVSGSSQVTPLLPTGTLSGSSQLTSSYDLRYVISGSITQTTWDNIASKPAGIVSGSSQIVANLSGSDLNLAGISGSSLNITGNAKIDGNVVIGGNITIGDATTDTVSFTADLASDIIPSGSNVRSLGSASKLFANVYATNLYGAINATNGIVSGSSQITYADISSIPSGIVSSSAQVNADSITNFDTNVKDKLNADGVISGSAGIVPLLPTGTVSGSSQVNADSITNFDENVKDKLNAETVVSGSSQIVGILGALNTFSASASSSLDNIQNYTSSLRAAFTASGANVTFSGNVTIPGNFTVAGTQTIVDSTTVQIGDNIIELNGSAAANGGLYVKDATAPNTATGSLLWDTTNDYWKAGVKDSEIKILLVGGDSVVSGSSQITISSTTGFTDYSSSVATAISSSVAAGAPTFANIVGKPAGLVSGSSQINLVNTNSGSFNTSMVGEDSGYLYYTDARVKTKLDAETVISGSSQVNANSITNFDENVKDKLNADAVVSGSLLGLLPAGTVSGSSQIAYADISSIPAGIVSGSTQVTALLPTGVISGSTQTVASLAGQNVSFGVISGSTLNITGNANIDGNLVLGGTITIGDNPTDNLVVNADLSSSIIPNNDNSFDLGSDTKRYKDIYGVNIYGGIKATNGVISGSSQLDSTTINLATLTSVSASGSFSGSFKGDGSQLTGIASTLAFSGSTGNDTLNLKTEALLVTGSNSISAAVTDNTITITADNASTSAKGVASFDATNFGVTSGNVAIKAGGVNAATLNADVAGTGLSLDGVDNSLKVDYGSTSGTAVEGNTSLTVQGTANEIEITGGSITLGSGGTVTIGLPDDVTISGSLTANGNVFLGNSSADSVTIAGNLFVQGTTTTVDSTTVQIGDNIIELNGSGAANGGLLVRDVTGGSTTSGSLLWDTTNDYWKAGAAGSEKEVARFNATPTSGSVQVIGAGGLFVNSQISDDAVKVTIGTDLIISGLTANSFVVSNGSKKLISVTPSNAGDLIQWNGSSFVASNELDGGTF